MKSITTHAFPYLSHAVAGCIEDQPPYDGPFVSTFDRVLLVLSSFSHTPGVPPCLPLLTKNAGEAPKGGRWERG